MRSSELNNCQGAFLCSIYCPCLATESFSEEPRSGITLCPGGGGGEQELQPPADLTRANYGEFKQFCDTFHSSAKNQKKLRKRLIELKIGDNAK